MRYEHDTLGRVTLRRKTRLSRRPDTWRSTWDAEDRLTSVITPDGTRWSLADPVRYLTTGFAAPDPAPPAQATRHLFTECLALVTTPLLDAVQGRVPAAVSRLRAAGEALRAQREDRHRADALLELIADLMEDCADR